MLLPILRFFLLLAGLSLLALPVQAQRTKSVVPDIDTEGHKGDMARAAQKKAGERFDKADADHDGSIAREEAGLALPYIAERFEQYDKNKDGKLSWEEFIGHDKWTREAAK